MDVEARPKGNDRIDRGVVRLNPKLSTLTTGNDANRLEQQDEDFSNSFFRQQGMGGLERVDGFFFEPVPIRPRPEGGEHGHQPEPDAE